MADLDPKFETRAELEAWAAHQLDNFLKDEPYTNRKVVLMLAVADRIRRVTLVHSHLIGEK